MTSTPSNGAPEIHLHADEVRGHQGRPRLLEIKLTVPDTITRSRTEYDMLFACGAQHFHVGSLDAARRLHAEMGKQIETWQAMVDGGYVVFK